MTAGIFLNNLTRNVCVARLFCFNCCEISLVPSRCRPRSFLPFRPHHQFAIGTITVACLFSELTNPEGHRLAKLIDRPRPTSSGIVKSNTLQHSTNRRRRPGCGEAIGSGANLWWAGHDCYLGPDRRGWLFELSCHTIRTPPSVIMCGNCFFFFVVMEYRLGHVCR